jgi:Na+-driven multidrug efflux pump
MRRLAVRMAARPAAAAPRLWLSPAPARRPSPRRRALPPQRAAAADADADASKSAAAADPDAGGELRAALALALPALALVLADPAQTLVDCAAVGRAAGTAQLAALGPNTFIFNTVAQVFGFISVAATTGVAAAAPGAPGLSGAEVEARRGAAGAALSDALALALVCGAAVALGLRLFGDAALAAMGTAPEVAPAALRYLRVRALAAPAVFAAAALQGAALGQRDARAPALAAAGATALNIAGDAALVWGLGWGVEGAAAATAGAQVAAAGWLLARAATDGRRPRGVPLRWAGAPTAAAARRVAELAAALVARTAVGVAAYAAMTIAATRLGPGPAAAHQVAMQ